MKRGPNLKRVNLILYVAKCSYRQWQKPQLRQPRSAAPAAWCRRRSPWIPLPSPWTSGDASWQCFARETGLKSDAQGSLSTEESHLITTDSGSFPLVIVTALRSTESGILLINTNNTPPLFSETILHTLVIIVKLLVLRKRHTADANTFLDCVKRVQFWGWVFVTAVDIDGLKFVLSKENLIWL